MSDLYCQQAYAYLKNALISKYGESRPASVYDLSEILLVLNVTGYYDEEETENVAIWDLPDDTTIVLFTTYETIRLFYYRSDLLFDFLPADGVYNTDGL